jgi:glyoxylase-like metal-dependent hydrolase (beta-lactamase superfamily II)
MVEDGAMSLMHLAGRVWLYPHHRDESRTQPCVAIVDLGDHSLAVDAGNSPDHGRAVRACVREAGLPPVATIVYTHHHWDHVWGACAWDVDDVVGHASGAPLLAEDAARPWSARYARTLARDNPRLSVSVAARTRAVRDWPELVVRPPTRVFDAELRLADRLVARHVGGRHAPDSTIVIDEESGVALLGDCFYPPPLHLRDERSTIDVAMLRDFAELPVQWLVDSHGPPRRR